MKHAEFGKVVAVLRKEQISFHSGQNWSQQDLASETGLSSRIVGRIERGEQARLDGEMLSSLARAFNFTSLERREFFAMASEVADREIVREDLCDNGSVEYVERFVCACISDRSFLGFCWGQSVIALTSWH